MIVQGTDEWLQARAGKITASRIADVLMKPTTAGYQNYRSQLICERLTGRPVDTFKSAAMQRGNDIEPQARAMFTMNTGLAVEETGFVDHPTIPNAGASPDGLIGDDGLVEIKCPLMTEHIRMLTGGKPKHVYACQMDWQMECTGRKWVRFVNFHPEFPDDLQMHIIEIERNEERLEQLREAVAAFEKDIMETMAKLPGVDLDNLPGVKA